MISDQRLLKIHFSMSEYQPYPLGYRIRNQNPILECLVDQTKFDSDWSGKFNNGLDLLMQIIVALENKDIAWPDKPELISNDEWISKMKLDAIFYYNYAKDLVEVQAHEQLLLELSSKYLNRSIHLIPFLENDEGITINSSNLSKYHIMFCNQLWLQNFFISINPDFSVMHNFANKLNLLESLVTQQNLCIGCNVHLGNNLLKNMCDQIKEIEPQVDRMISKCNRNNKQFL